MRQILALCFVPFCAETLGGRATRHNIVQVYSRAEPDARGRRRLFWSWWFGSFLHIQALRVLWRIVGI